MNDVWPRIESALLRAWIVGFAVLIVWLLALLFFSDAILAAHGAIFHLSLHELELVMYCGMGLWKMGVMLGFFVPWLTLRMTRKT